MVELAKLGKRDVGVIAARDDLFRVALAEMSFDGGTESFDAACGGVQAGVAANQVDLLAAGRRIGRQALDDRFGEAPGAVFVVGDDRRRPRTWLVDEDVGKASDRQSSLICAGSEAPAISSASIE